MNKSMLYDNQILKQISRIHLISIITLIVQNLNKEDLPLFEEILTKKDSLSLLVFARAKNPEFEDKILTQIIKVNQKLNHTT